MFRKTLYITLLALACAACSPQQRLTRLLTQHPELRLRDTILQRDITATIPDIRRDTTLKFSNLQTFKFSNSGPSPCNCDSILHELIGDSLSINAGNATATITHQPGQLNLAAHQRPDTIRRTVEVQVPVIEYVEVERKETPIQAFCRISGIILWTLLAIAVLIRIIKYFL
ncbi:MAG: hypothetical protein ACI3Z8_04770 [Paludibacteraceae bacterium]